jgi:hypothetical protein
VDQIPGAFRQWKQHGYRINRIVPLDMFPGTAGLEVLILLEKDSGTDPEKVRSGKKYRKDISGPPGRSR